MSTQEQRDAWRAVLQQIITDIDDGNAFVATVSIDRPFVRVPQEEGDPFEPTGSAVVSFTAVYGGGVQPPEAPTV